MKNITLSADEHIIQQARKRATEENTTLNALFREWLERYVVQEHAAGRYEAIMAQLSYVDAGRKFTRDEMNER